MKLKAAVDMKYFCHRPENKHQVVLNQTDINELRSCLDLIREREQRIRVILSTLDTNY
jgi:hypothetical protein